MWRQSNKHTCICALTTSGFSSELGVASAPFSPTTYLFQDIPEIQNESCGVIISVSLLRFSLKTNYTQQTWAWTLFFSDWAVLKAKPTSYCSIFHDGHSEAIQLQTWVTCSDQSHIYTLSVITTTQKNVITYTDISRPGWNRVNRHTQTQLEHTCFTTLIQSFHIRDIC